MNKKIFLLLSVILMILFTTAYAAKPITVQLNGEYIDFTDENGNVVNPEMINNRTMVPMRKIFEVVGAEVEWDGEERKITATTEEKIINLQINNTTASVQDKTTEEVTEITLDAAPVILNNRTMVPVRFIAESLEKQVGWDNENRCVIVIDYSFIEENLNAYAPALVEFLEMEKEEMKSFHISTTVSGTLNYRDEEKRAYNEKVNFDGEIDIKKNKDDILSVEIELETSGNGEIQKSLEKMGYDDFKYEIISNGEETYTKSSIYDTKKWKESSINIELKIDENYNLESYVEALKIPESEVDINSYDSIQKKLEEAFDLFGEDKLTVTGDSNKKFKLSLDIAQELSKLDESGMNQLLEFLSLGSVNLNTTVSFKEDKLKDIVATIDFYIENADDEENTKVKVEIESNIKSTNGNIKLSMPKSSQIEKGD